MIFVPSEPASRPESSADVRSGVRIGQVFFDGRRRRLLCLNRTARELHAEGLPFSAAELTGARLAHVTGDPVKAEDLPLAVAWRKQQAAEATFVWQRAGGVPWRVDWSVAPLKSESGETVGLAGTVVCSPPDPDWRLLAELAHDLRTPLQAIGMLSALLDVRALGDPRLRDSLEHVRAAADRAMEIGRDLLEWCRRPTAQGRPVRPTWFPLEPFLARLAHEQTPEAQRKRLTLHVDVAAAHDWEVYTDQVRLGRLLANLLSNAVRYTPAGRVELTATWREEPPGGLVLGVVDSGAGISSEEQESIFEPYERGRAGKESDSGGSGLGLAAVDNLVRELGLNLEVFSEFQRGSAFHLSLPAPQLRRAAANGHHA